MKSHFLDFWRVFHEIEGDVARRHPDTSFAVFSAIYSPKHRELLHVLRPHRTVFQHWGRSASAEAAFARAAGYLCADAQADLLTNRIDFMRFRSRQRQVLQGYWSPDALEGTAIRLQEQLKSPERLLNAVFDALERDHPTPFEEALVFLPQRLRGPASKSRRVTNEEVAGKTLYGGGSGAQPFPTGYPWLVPGDGPDALRKVLERFVYLGSVLQPEALLDLATPEVMAPQAFAVALLDRGCPEGIVFGFIPEPLRPRELTNLIETIKYEGYGTRIAEGRFRIARDMYARRRLTGATRRAAFVDVVPWVLDAEEARIRDSPPTNNAPESAAAAVQERVRVEIPVGVLQAEPCWVDLRAVVGHPLSGREDLRPVEVQRKVQDFLRSIVASEASESRRLTAVLRDTVFFLDHEVRNTINSLRGSAEVLRASAVGTPAGGDADAAKLRHQAMLAHLGTVADAARAFATTPDERKTKSLSAMVTQVKRYAETHAESTSLHLQSLKRRGFHFRFDIDGEAEGAYECDEHVQWVLLDAARDAIKHRARDPDCYPPFDGEHPTFLVRLTLRSARERGRIELHLTSEPHQNFAALTGEFKARDLSSGMALTRSLAGRRDIRVKRSQEAIPGRGQACASVTVVVTCAVR